MSLLANLTTDTAIADEKDVIFNGGAKDSGLYEHTISMAYITVSSGGATGLVISLKDASNSEVRQTLWMTSGTDKGAKNYYEKDGERHYLPGFILANSLCLLTVGKEISAMQTETKVINIWSSEARAEVPTKAEVVMELLGKPIITGLIKQAENKTVKNAVTNQYEATAEVREINDIDKFFRAKDRLTTAEIRAQVTEPGFITKWEQQWTGKVRDRVKAVAGGAKVPAGASVSGGTKKPTTSLFG